MILICTLGGSVFLALGIINLVQGISGGSAITLALGLSAAAINRAIGIWGLISSWFHRYTEAWNQRLDKLSRSEETLRHAMEGNGP